MKQNLFTYLFILTTTLTSVTASGGQTLTPLALYNRCFAQLTGTRPLLSDA